MSHFTVLVVGDVDEQLRPFQENNMLDCPEEFLEFNDTEDKYLKEYQEKGVGKVRLEDGTFVLPWDEQFRVKGKMGMGSDTHKVPEHLEEVTCYFKDTYKTFEEFVDKWHGVEERDPKTGRYGYWENPNAKWDWYEVGGRWPGLLRIKSGGAKISEPQHGALEVMFSGHSDSELKEFEENQVDSALCGDVDWDYLRKINSEEAGEQYDKVIEANGGPIENFISWKEIRDEKYPDNIDKAKDEYNKQDSVVKTKDVIRWRDDLEDYMVSREEYCQKAYNQNLTFAILHNGQWWEKGEMGWWGCVRNEKDDDTVSNEYWDIISKIGPEEVVTVVDCHI